MFGCDADDARADTDGIDVYVEGPRTEFPSLESRVDGRDIIGADRGGRFLTCSSARLMETPRTRVQ
jgi:hypothetical protein